MYCKTFFFFIKPLKALSH